MTTPRRVLILVENPPSAFDRRVWQEATTLHAAGYAVEYGVALTRTLLLVLKVLLTRGFDVIHAFNPPDLFFLIGSFFKLFGKKFLFDHHDLCPELYEAKFARRQEGDDYLLHALQRIVKVHGRRDVHFGPVGSGTSLDEMKTLAATLDVADYVTFAGRLPETAKCWPC